MINIATNKFPFLLNSHNFLIQDMFADNEDYIINYIKTAVSLKQKELKLELSLCSEDYQTFYEYLIIDLDMSKNLFYIQINNNGIVEDVLCDIISNPKVKKRVSSFEISFDIAIIPQ